MQFYNNPAICYSLSLPPGVTRPSRTRLGSGPWVWLKEAFNHWVASTTDDITCDNKDPFGRAVLSPEESGDFWQWFKIGVQAPGTPTSDEAKKALVRDLSTLLKHHELLCNRVQDQAQQLLDETDQIYLSQCRNQQHQNVNGILSPVCRAVLLITPPYIRLEMRVVVVFTGNNSSLLAKAPTFASIPEEGILAHWGHNAVEVSLKTAVEYLRHVDAEEERVNDVLHGITRGRFEALSAMLYQEVREKSQGAAEFWDNRGVFSSSEVEEAVRTALEKRRERQ